MEIKTLKFDDDLWNPVVEYARNCSWRAGKMLAKLMQENRFLDWERVFVAIDDQNIAGYCTITKTDTIPDVNYTPYIGFIFVGEDYRGMRLSEQLIKSALSYAKDIGLKKVYLVTREKGLYEKYGFIKIDERKNATGDHDQIFHIDI
ncbi:GNAT family N-acetyltransferase [Chryseobacterium sp. T16E-39]|uniref:GNAT family N-acetyltransferase n=1 Tax=Chryseobacterium sp. T16E-39 TaxID=2015076 RepID=UPI000B5B42AE|nr:GNAT family N-acetyltransferase [Chryseobacterium sp. T16E-39]ASK32178.1 GNAT family N-acetyltransferase [Chryseobacterium sp. T16E-39]